MLASFGLAVLSAAVFVAQAGFSAQANDEGGKQIYILPLKASVAAYGVLQDDQAREVRLSPPGGTNL